MLFLLWVLSQMNSPMRRIEEVGDIDMNKPIKTRGMKENPNLTI